MKVSNVNNNKINFNSYHVLGIDSENYRKILKPHDELLNNITKGFDVVIQEETGPLRVFDEHLEENVYLNNLVGVLIKPLNDANTVVPRLKMLVYSGAGEIQSDENKAKEIITLIKKGISLYA